MKNTIKIKIPEDTNKKHPSTSKKLPPLPTDKILYRLAFDNTAQAIVISNVSTGKVITANRAAYKLLGYSKKDLLSKGNASIFDKNESSFKEMLKQRTAEGKSTALITAIKKSNRRFPSEITSAVFMGENHMEKAVTTITDLSQKVLNQKKIDTKKEKIVAHNISDVISNQKIIDTKNKKIVADNITLAKSNQKKLDIKKEKIVADNIALASSKQNNIDIKKEKIVAHNISLAKSNQKRIDTKKEKIVADNITLAKSKQKKIDIKKEKIVADNIALASSKQKNIDTKKEKVVADNIISALAKSNERLAGVNERWDKERADIEEALQENVNQLLAASKMYIDMAKPGGANNEIYLSHSSEYTHTAIEEIRKLTKGLPTHFIKNFGLCESIEIIRYDLMAAYKVKISCKVNSFIEHSVDNKFKLNVYRIVKEQLNNILKHAKATEIALNLSQNKKSIILSISDNGVGFDTGKEHKGIGVDNIISSASSFKGTADFVSQPGRGCLLTVTFPVTDALLNKN